ncbi:MAG: flagellar basal body rod C-terminal domain-containing protein, partial [Pseudomonadota bacterium]
GAEEHAVFPEERVAVRDLHDADLQGFLEKSNVNPVTELARMIEVQRSYELGQKLLDREDERIRAVTRTLGQAPG